MNAWKGCVEGRGICMIAFPWSYNLAEYWPKHHTWSPWPWRLMNKNKIKYGALPAAVRMPRARHRMQRHCMMNQQLLPLPLSSQGQQGNAAVYYDSLQLSKVQNLWIHHLKWSSRLVPLTSHVFQCIIQAREWCFAMTMFAKTAMNTKWALYKQSEGFTLWTLGDGLCYKG